MSIYLNKDSKLIVQGMTGGMGSKHTTLMLVGMIAVAVSLGSFAADEASSDGRASRDVFFCYDIVSSG